MNGGEGGRGHLEDAAGVDSGAADGIRRVVGDVLQGTRDRGRRHGHAARKRSNI